jgi:DNA-binding response OmpR family regulator
MDSILIVDKDRDLCGLLREILAPEGFQVDLAFDRETGIRMALRKEYILIIVDVMLPGGSNDFSVLRQISSRAPRPTIVLSPRAREEERIAALETGADDYLQKPFNPRELVARVHAVLRRTRVEGAKIRVGDVEMDTGSRVVFRSGGVIDLTTVEFNILEILLRRAGRLVSREELTPAALGRSFYPYDRSIDVHVCRLRKKLGYEISGLPRIRSIRGEGYLYALTRPGEAEPFSEVPSQKVQGG